MDTTTTTQRQSHWVTLLMIVTLISIAVAGYFASPFLLPKADLRISPDPGCDLQRGKCAATLPNGERIELALLPRPIPALAPLRVEVGVTGFSARRVEVDFAGETMNMGYNRTLLASMGGGLHAGEATLPVCITGSMDWIVTVLIETDRRRIAVPFRVSVGP